MAENGGEGAGAERGGEGRGERTERGPGVTEISLSGERLFRRSRSAHMLCVGAWRL